MSRQLRIEYQDAWYHVMNRGAARQVIFDSDDLRHTFFDILAEAHNRYQIEIHAYCLMGNHYHLLVKTPNANLSRSMCYINSLYARKFNISHKRDGPLFRGRYRAILIEDDHYRLNVSRYIHLNPTEASMVTEPSLYQWSSMSAYTKHIEPPPWLYLRVIHGYFPCDTAHLDYAAFVDKGLDIETEEYYTTETPLPIFGSKSFIEEITEQFAEPRPRDVEVPEQSMLIRTGHKSLNELIHSSAKLLQIPFKVLTECYQGVKNPSRDILIHALLKHADYKQHEIARHFNMKSYTSASLAYRRGKKHIQNSRDLRKQYLMIVGELFEYE